MSFNLESIATNLELIANHSAKYLLDYRYHKNHNAQANRILRNIEKKLGRTNPQHIKLADSYARDVFGHQHFAPWLYVYTAVSREFKEGWIPDNFYGTTIVPTMKGWYGKISHLKPLTNALFGSESFPDIAYLVNGLFFATDYSPISPPNIRSWLFKNDKKIIFKKDSSSRGKGVFILSEKNFNPTEIKKLGNGVFQSFIVQHKLFDELSPNSVATLRITSVVDDTGTVSVRACYLRLGRQGDTHVQSKSQICVPINIFSGAFSDEGYLTNWLTTDEHPDTGIKFSGNTIPAFSCVLSTIIDLHKKVPFARCIGWDVAIDANGCVKLLEWNAKHNGIKLHEATQGPCFADLNWEKIKARRMTYLQV